MIAKDIGFQPELRVLPQQDQEKIFNSALRVLEEGGMQLMHEGALRLLKDAGCIIEGECTVKIPVDMVKRAMASAPDNIPVYNRQGERVMDREGGGHILAPGRI